MVGVKKVILQLNPTNAISSATESFPMYTNQSNAMEIVRFVEGNLTGAGTATGVSFAGLALARSPYGITSFANPDCSNNNEFWADSPNVLWHHGLCTALSVSQVFDSEIYAMGEMTLHPNDVLYLVTASNGLTSANYNLTLVMGIEC